MKKKHYMLVKSILLCAMFLCLTAMCACGLEEGTESSGGMVSESETEESENISEESTDVTEESGEESAFLQVNLQTTYDYDYDFDSIQYAKMIYDTIVCGGNAEPALASAVEQWNHDLASGLETYFEQLCADARVAYADNPEYFFGPYETSIRLNVKRADATVLSVEEKFYDFCGGMHGQSGYGGCTWDAKTGEIIELEDVVTDVNRLPEVIADKFREKYPDIIVFGESLEDILSLYNQPDGLYEYSWTLEYDGIIFYFGHYELASYADGLQQVKILYNEMPDLFVDKYFADAGQNYITHFESFYGTDTDLDGDYVTENVCVIGYYDADVDMSMNYTVILEDMQYEAQERFYEMDSYLVKHNGQTFLYIERNMENDYRVVDVYELKKDAIVTAGSFVGALDSFTNPDEFVFWRRIDMLGTLSGSMTCGVGEDGMPVHLRDNYEIYGGSVVSTIELEVETLDENGNVTGTTTYPAGTEFFFDRTDAETYMDMTLSDGSRCRMKVTAGWPQMVNGMPAEECFEALLYAG